MLSVPTLRSRLDGSSLLNLLEQIEANIAVGLRSMPVRYLFLDEVDGYPLDVEGEGDAISLAEAHTRTFARRKIFIVSTPTISGASSIEREYESSDQRRYFVPCPHCSHRQWLRFEQLRWAKGEPQTAAYICESCDSPIEEHHKTWMLEHGEWRAMTPENSAKTAGFHLSSLYSPVGWRGWQDVAAAWEGAVSKESGSASAIKTFKNTELGETGVEEGEAPDWQRLIERREDYPLGTVPDGGTLLVGGADVQKDRIEVPVWAFGRGKESWLVEHRVLMGDEVRDSVWKQLGAVFVVFSGGVTLAAQISGRLERFAPWAVMDVALLVGGLGAIGMGLGIANMPVFLLCSLAAGADTGLCWSFASVVTQAVVPAQKSGGASGVVLPVLIDYGGVGVAAASSFIETRSAVQSLDTLMSSIGQVLIANGVLSVLFVPIVTWPGRMKAKERVAE